MSEGKSLRGKVIATMAIGLAIVLGVLVVFAAFASISFGSGLAALLWMSIVLCAVIGIVRREQPFGAALNHWDETVAYAALCCLVMGFD